MGVKAFKGSHEGAAAPLIDGAAIMRRKWRAARAPGKTLPSYEEVTLGGLGRLSDDVVVMGRSPSDDYRILYAGQRVAEWLGAAAGAEIATLSPESGLALNEAITRALDTNEPSIAAAHRLRDGLVETYDVLALPLANRWGEPLVCAYVRARGAGYNLVDAIFRSTTQGILALGAVRGAAGAAGEVVDFQVVALNEGACRMLRLTEGELRWRRLRDLEFDRLHAPRILARLRGTLLTGEADEFETELSFADGVAHFNLSCASIGDLLAVTLVDITDLKKREASFRLLFDENPAPMYLYDPATLKFMGVNDAAVRHYGYSRERFLEMTLRDIRPRDEWKRLEDITAASPRHAEGTWRHIKADGTQIEVLAYARSIDFDSRPAVLVAIVDITERRQAEARIAHMAHHDALTDLPNRLRFNMHLAEALPQLRRHGDKLAMLCLDLDHFKDVNDTLGHIVADRLLKIAAERIRRELRQHDLAARLGGDEFAIIQMGVQSPKDASVLAGRLIEALSAPYQVEDHLVVVGASIGIALAPGDGLDGETLLRNADMALYRAKAEGRGTFHFFEPDMDRAIQTRRRLELDLRKAFAEGQFELYYQPLLDLGRGEVASFEALLRWRHAERGMVSPGEFIPLCEEIGLIVPLGEWVIRQACADAARWPEQVKVSVNLSPTQFKSKNLVPAIIGALASSRLPASQLELEITESVLLTENETNLGTLHQLRELGVRISLDDFGTGYSSLSYLTRFPFDKIKIDKSFVSELADRPDCLAIVRAVTGLATSLGIATTAEGVETQAQLDRLRAEGCTEAQGYLLSPPRPMSETSTLLKKFGVGRAAA
ncbi:MAG TPA: EAL domain-containing protein [Roseiarcus sp.]|nr:EAL domain-containing protein [Roseiarcus sp.]